jgi:hypothetical protein
MWQVLYRHGVASFAGATMGTDQHKIIQQTAGVTISCGKPRAESQKPKKLRTHN